MKRWMPWVALVSAVSVWSCSPNLANYKDSTGPEQKIQLPAHTEFYVKFNKTLDGASIKPGDFFTVTLTTPVAAKEVIVIPAGTEFKGRVTNRVTAQKAGDAPYLSTELVSFNLGGSVYEVKASPRTFEGNAMKQNPSDMGRPSDPMRKELQNAQVMQDSQISYELETPIMVKPVNNTKPLSKS